jgi:hypothetical protein
MFEYAEKRIATSQGKEILDELKNIKIAKVNP